MEQYVGLDVSQKQTSVCVVDGGGQIIWEGKCASTPEAIATTIRTRAPEAVRVGLESGPLSAWHWHELRKLGLPVICLDARHVKAAPAPEILRTLAAQGERSMSADELASALGKKPSGGHWNSGIAILRNNRLIETDPGAGSAQRYRLAILLRS